MFEKISGITTGFFKEKDEKEAREMIASSGYTILSTREVTVMREKGKLFEAVEIEKYKEYKEDKKSKKGKKSKKSN